LAIATACGVGYVPIAPGTFGTAAGLLLWFAIPHSMTVQSTVIILLFAIGSWSASVAERHFHTIDPGPVVIDEVMGMLITLFLVPIGWKGAIAGFFLFRFFDVIKPFPANRLEHLRAGIGVMADDAMAAVYANIALRAMLALSN
jgi:phosphatidylglycerophosphatase A